MTRTTTAAPAYCAGRSFPAPPLLAQAVGAPPQGADATAELATFIAEQPLDDTGLLTRARDLIDWLPLLELSNSSRHPDEFDIPDAPYVLVLDQPATLDPSTTEADLREVLVFARTETYAPKVVVLTAEGGLLSAQEGDADVTFLPPTANPYRLFSGATAVFAHGAAEGFDALLAGHRPRVFGRPWYHGWGLTADENADPTRSRNLTRAQLAAAALILWPQWHDAKGAPVEAEMVLAHVEAQLRAVRADARGYVASGILPWKRRFMRAYFGANGLVFSNDPDVIENERALGRRHIHWGPTEGDALRLEDGFLRSKGLGAALVRPVSLVMDDLGLYFDPTRPSRLESLIAARAEMPPHAEARITRLIARLTDARLSKYNVRAGRPDLPEGYRVLVAGQVEDDASIRLGAGDICTNDALLTAARAAHPEAVLIYKPHPDVEAGLRAGQLANADQIADVVARDADPIALIEACDAVWTMTSQLGFEALLRGKPVTCTGAPFYAGWGLTTDLGAVPARRGARVSLLGLAHAALIDYPRYVDPKSGAPLSPEEAVDLLERVRETRSPLAQWGLARLRWLRAYLLGLAK